MDIKIEFKGLKELIANMDNLAKTQLPFATAKALTKTAGDVKRNEIQQMSTKLDRPTPYVINSLYVKPATKQNLVSEVGFKDYAGGGTNKRGANIIYPHVEAGKRHLKGFESALQRIGVLPKGMYIAPGAACPLDAYGNIPSGLIVKIMSYFRAFGEQGYKANITDERKAKLKRGTKKKTGFEYVVIKPNEGWGTGQHLAPGIYMRQNVPIGRGRIRPIMMFVKIPSYRKRFPFYETAQKIVDIKFKMNFDEAMREALLTMKRTG